MRLFRIANPYTQMRSDYNHEVLATEREPEGQPRRARGDDEASVARSAARGAYRHHHSTQHCAKRAAIHRFLFICVNLCANLSLANHAARRVPTATLSLPLFRGD